MESYIVNVYILEEFMLFRQNENEKIRMLKEENEKLKSYIELNSTYPQKAKDIIDELDDKKKILDEAINEARESKKRYDSLIAEAKKMINEYRKMYEYFIK